MDLLNGPFHGQFTPDFRDGASKLLLLSDNNGDTRDAAKLYKAGDIRYYLFLIRYHRHEFILDINNDKDTVFPCHETAYPFLRTTVHALLPASFLMFRPDRIA
jgi:hypothetical protein